MEQRKLEEMSFHDQRERDRHTLSDDAYQRKYSNKKWYAITEGSARHIERWLRAHVPGKTVLDYCCGLGGASLQLAELGAAELHGIDISPESVATARQLVTEAGFGDRAHFQVMDAEHTTFPDNTFDVVICFGVLHHLDVTAAFPEIARILKPGGFVIAGEALGHNPVIALYRQLTPHLRTSWEKEHILGLKELRIARRFFGALEVRYFHLFGILAVPFRRTPVFKPVLRALDLLDAVILRIPGVQLMAWQMIFVLSKPKKTPRGAAQP